MVINLALPVLVAIHKKTVRGKMILRATLFLKYLDKNHILFKDGRKLISDSALVAITLMIAKSDPGEKEIMVSLIMNFLK